MSSRIIHYLIFTAVFISLHLNAQQVSPDKGKFIPDKNAFIDSVTKASNVFREEDRAEKMKFKMDFSGLDLPKSKEEFKQVWHFDPISQGLSGMCWCFSTTSFLESEIYRIHNRKIKLSELHTVYWEYVEKARRYVKKLGDSEFGEGSEANAVTRIWKKYGVVPTQAYTGLKKEQTFHDHRQMFEDMKDYLEFIKKNKRWNEEEVLQTIKLILNRYIGEPPQYIEVNGKKLTPLQYLKQVVKLDLDDYVVFLSVKEKPYYQLVEYEVPDNWWHSEEYHNIPLDEYMAILRKAIRENYSVSLGGDVSEPGYDAHTEVAMVPSFDIPAAYINEDARQLRFSDESTTDDHGIHIVGYQEREGKDWYLIKDSGSGSRNGPNFGYYFYHEDYIKLKMMDYMIHKDAAKEILKKF